MLCPKCGEMKEEQEFGYRRGTRLQSWCKKCRGKKPDLAVAITDEKDHSAELDKLARKYVVWVTPVWKTDVVTKWRGKQTREQGEMKRWIYM